MSSDGLSFDKLLQEARLLRQSGENKKAIEVYRRALEIKPESIVALNEMGVTHIRIGEQAEAIMVFDTAISIKPDEASSHINKVEAFLTLGSFEEALISADIGLIVAPTNAVLHEKRARALESLLRIPEAVDAFNESIRYDSENPETWKALALCLDAQAKWVEVARAYRIAGSLHQKRGELRDAESCFKFAEMAEKSSSDEMA
ncbi:MAG: tetratricopeptide repeat protein [Candidatus Thorarchaeota archaeon]